MQVLVNRSAVFPVTARPIQNEAISLPRVGRAQGHLWALQGGAWGLTWAELPVREGPRGREWPRPAPRRHPLRAQQPEWSLLAAGLSAACRERGGLSVRALGVGRVPEVGSSLQWQQGAAGLGAGCRPSFLEGATRLAPAGFPTRLSTLFETPSRQRPGR